MFSTLRSIFAPHKPVAVLAAVEPPPVAPAPEPFKLLVSNFFDGPRFTHQPVFKYNQLSTRNLINRKAVLQALRTCTRDELYTLTFEQRRTLFAFLKQETARYYGTAVRQADTPSGKRGTPLPQLQFPTRQDAAAYRQLLQDAMRNLSSHVYRRTPEPVAAR